MRFKSITQSHYSLLFALFAMLAACSSINPIGNNATLATTPTHVPTSTIAEACPAPLNSNPNCYTPRAFRLAYSVQALTDQGYTGKGQTVIDIVSFGSPTLQQDMDVFDKQFGLPPITIQVVSPLGTVPYDPNKKDMAGWASETELDAQVIHAIAPDAHIIVMTSPVDETEGTIGLPEFLKLEQYAVAHQLGQIFSQSFVASEATLADSPGQKLVKTFTNFYQQITTQQGFTVVSGSGDNGATDWANIAATTLSPNPTVNFPADVPWVTAVGGTTLHNAPDAIHRIPTYNESAWSGSGGGISKFFAEPVFQKSMSSSTQSQLAGHRGLPDIAGDANPDTSMIHYIFGRWTQIGGTSASTPFLAGIVAIANQMAGHPLGFINPALYKLGTSTNAQKDFRDITSGSNDVDYGNIHVKGFQAIPGWDAVTGCGSPQASQFVPDLIAAMK
ncbi:MAG TPA: S53 family peptidase [Ktedonobacteraceae bacterium]|nr:S53 family peptidase [Ktedonobacteraceae bacterium]